MQRIFLFYYCLIVSMSLFATNYYVSKSGNDSNNGWTLETAHASINIALGKVVAGDTIFVRSGVYSMAKTGITRSGSAAKRIVLCVYPGDQRPILDFSTSTDYGIGMRCNYWHIKGIRFRGAATNGLRVNTAYNLIEFCDFFENRDSGLILREAGCHDNVFLNCDAYLNSDFIVGSSTYKGGNADGFAPKLDCGTNNKFIGCRSWRNSDDGWDGYLKTTADDITTILENCWTWGNGYVRVSGRDTTTSAMNGNGFKMGGSDNKDLRHNFVVKNCLSFNNKAKGFDQNSSTGSITLYHCTAYKNKSNNYYLNSSGVTLGAGKVFTVKNCAGDNSTVPSFRSGTILSNNNWSATSADFMSVDTTGMSGPRKLDGSLPDLPFMHLQTTPKSALIDAGMDLNLPYNNTLPDIGCYETAGVPVKRFKLTTSTTVGGSIVLSNPDTSYNAGYTLTLTATPSAGFVFSKWLNNKYETIGITPVMSIALVSDTYIKAAFVGATGIKDIQQNQVLCFEKNKKVNVLFHLGAEEMVDIRLFSENGILLDSIQQRNVSGICEINIGKNLKSGIYFCRITRSGSVKTHKVLVE